MLTLLAFASAFHSRCSFGVFAEQGFLPCVENRVHWGHSSEVLFVWDAPGTGKEKQ